MSHWYTEFFRQVRTFIKLDTQLHKNPIVGVVRDL